MSSKITLKTGPFCDNPPQTKEWVQGHHNAIRIWCDDCSVETRCQGVRDTAIEKWNTRSGTYIPAADFGRIIAALSVGKHYAKLLIARNEIEDTDNTHHIRSLNEINEAIALARKYGGAE